MKNRILKNPSSIKTNQTSLKYLRWSNEIKGCVWEWLRKVQRFESQKETRWIVIVIVVGTGQTEMYWEL